MWGLIYNVLKRHTAMNTVIGVVGGIRSLTGFACADVYGELFSIFQIRYAF